VGLCVGGGVGVGGGGGGGGGGAGAAPPPPATWIFCTNGPRYSLFAHKQGVE